MSEPFAAILGQRPAIDALQRLLSTGRLPHALLFRGPEGVGKASVARLLAAVLLCDEAGVEACGNCRSCRALTGSAHPDFAWVGLEPRPSDGELRKEIVIDQIRRLTRLAGVAPRQSPRRLFVIDPADRMTREAQNGLLKTLEEPPGNTLLMLVASRPHLLLPTVRSRCFGVGFSPLRPGDLTGILERRGMDQGEAQARAALAGGRPGAALGLDLDAMRRRREEILEMLESLASPARRELGRIPEMGAALAGKEEAELIEGLELMQGLLRDVARCSCSDDDAGLIHLDLARRLSALAPRLGAARAAALVATIDEARGHLRVNANRTLLAESVLTAVALD